jgi:hypothetical protein
MFELTLIWLMNAGEIVFLLYMAVCLLILLPLFIFRRTRKFSAILIVAGTWVASGILWITSVGILYFGWGLPALFFGLFFVGIGVVPVAWVLSLVHWMPKELGDLALLTGGTILPRLVVAFWAVKSQD